MSLEWARARLLQHAAALRKLQEARCAADAKIVRLPRGRPATAPKQETKGAQPGAAPPIESAVVLKFARSGGRRA
jgi:hypothetical protein